MARCAFSFWLWAAAPSAWRADRTRRNIVNQLRVDNIGQRFFMTVRPEESEKRRGILVNTAGGCDAPRAHTWNFHHRWYLRVVGPPWILPKKNSDKRSSIIAISLFFLLLCSSNARCLFYSILFYFPLWNSLEFEINDNELDLESLLILEHSCRHAIIRTDCSIDNKFARILFTWIENTRSQKLRKSRIFTKLYSKGTKTVSRLQDWFLLFRNVFVILRIILLK